MALVETRQGDFVKLTDSATGLWVFASGPDFPTINRDFPTPHDGATFWHSGLDRLYFWSGEHQEWYHLLDHPTGAISYFDLDGHDMVADETADGIADMTPVDVPAELNPSSLDFDTPADGRLRYMGARDGHAVVQCTWSLTSVGNPDLVLAIAKNGEIVPSSRVFDSAQGTSAAGSAVRCLTTVANGDYFELRAGEAGGTSTLSFKSLNLFAQVRFHL
jgi:hypothetical protein